jgi:energy-coupling factor transport system permease protein
MLGSGVLIALLGLRAAGKRGNRTAYRPDPWLAPEWLTLASGVLVATAFMLAPAAALSISVTPMSPPPVPAGPLVAVLLAAGPALWTPPLPVPAQAPGPRRAHLPARAEQPARAQAPAAVHSPAAAPSTGSLAADGQAGA